MSNPFIGPKGWIWSNILGMGKGDKQTDNKFQPSKKIRKQLN